MQITNVQPQQRPVPAPRKNIPSIVRSADQPLPTMTAEPAGDTAAAAEGTAINQDDDTGGARPKTTVSVYGL